MTASRRQFLQIAGASFLGLAIARPAWGQTGPSLVFSRSSDRSNPQPLAGQITGTIYVFVAPVGKWADVRFFLDGSLCQSEANPPWDFAGGNATTANPYTPTSGSHTITAELRRGSVETISAIFTVGTTSTTAGTPSTTSTSGPTSTTQPPTGQVLTFSGRKWLVGGIELPVAGLPRNLRLVQAVADFSDKVTGWDAAANTAAFVAALPTFKGYGVDAITINMQGGNPGGASTTWGQDYNNSTFNADGSMKAAYQDRLTSALNGMVNVGMVPIVGIFYQRQDQILTNEAAVKAAVGNAVDFLSGWKNRIVVEVANEADVALYHHPILGRGRIRELVKTFRDAGYHAGFSLSGGVCTTTEAGSSDIIFLHGNDKPDDKITEFANTARTRFPNCPATFNEDGASASGAVYPAARYLSHLNRAISAGAGWGMHDSPEYQTVGPTGTSMTKLSWEPTSTKTKEVLTAMRNLA